MPFLPPHPRLLTSRNRMIGKLFRHLFEIAQVAVTPPTALGMRGRRTAGIKGPGGYIGRFMVERERDRLCVEAVTWDGDGCGALEVRG